MRYYFPNYDNPNPLAKLALGRKPEHPEKTHHFRQSVDRLFSHPPVAGIEPTNSGERRLLWRMRHRTNELFFYQWKWSNRSDQLRSLSERVVFFIRPALKRNCSLWNATGRSGFAPKTEEWNTFQTRNTLIGSSPDEVITNNNEEIITNNNENNNEIDRLKPLNSKHEINKRSFDIYGGREPP
jgi:hypothetical protein